MGFGAMWTVYIIQPNSNHADPMVWNWPNIGNLLFEGLVAACIVSRDTPMGAHQFSLKRVPKVVNPWPRKAVPYNWIHCCGAYSNKGGNKYLINKILVLFAKADAEDAALGVAGPVPKQSLQVPCGVSLPHIHQFIPQSCAAMPIPHPHESPITPEWTPMVGLQHPKGCTLGRTKAMGSPVWVASNQLVKWMISWVWIGKAKTMLHCYKLDDCKTPYMNEWKSCKNADEHHCGIPNRSSLHKPYVFIPNNWFHPTRHICLPTNIAHN